MRRAIAQIVRDATYSARQLAAAPTFTLAAIVSLALGIAVNSAAFSVISALLLRPLAGADQSDLVRIGRTARGEFSFRSSSYRDFRYLDAHASTLEAVFGEQLQTLTLSGPEGAEIASGELVTGTYFAGLRVGAARGRTLTDDDDRTPAAGAVVVISDHLWRRRFAADPQVLGRVLTINTRPFTIVGITPASFAGTFPGVRVDLWIPSQMVGTISARPTEEPSLMLMGRLASGQSLGAAAAELDALALQMAREDPRGDERRSFAVAPARGAHPLIARFIGTFLWLLLGMVFTVLLIACANVAALLLARATARRGELAVRLALGATRSRLVAQLLVESALLAGAGSVTGLMVVVGALRLVNALVLVPGPTGAPIFLDLRIDTQVLAFSIAATLAAVLAFGLVPALRATKVDLISDIRGSACGSPRTRSLMRPRWGRGRLHGTLVGLQVTLSTMLLIAAVLLSRSLDHASRLDVGFRPENVALASFNLELPGYDARRVRGFHDALLERTRQLPGVAHAALADFVPMGDRGSNLTITIADALQPSDRASLRVAYNRVSDDYFATMQQPLVEGRELARHDRQRSLPVAIVNKAFADRFWPGTAAVGRLVRIDDEPVPREVVGVTANARYASFGDDVRPLLILPADQRAGAQLTLHVRSLSEHAAVLGDVVRLAQAIDPNVALQKGTTMRSAMAFSLFPAQVARAVFGIAGAIGLVLASCGLYGLISYACEQRRKDVGVMLALGASRRHVLRTVVGGGLVVVLCGIVLGAGLASGAGRLFAALLYGVRPTDPLTFASVGIVLAGVALVATGTAVRRSLRVDPIVTLREN
jgi:predicted permease